MSLAELRAAQALDRATAGHRVFPAGCVVVGGAGSGKTTALSELVAGVDGPLTRVSGTSAACATRSPSRPAMRGTRRGGRYRCSC